MDLVVILKKLEDAYNQEDWNIIEEIIETIKKIDERLYKLTR